MITIEKLTDLDRAVAEAAFCPEPPLSERRAIHESGAWRWVAKYTGMMDASELAAAVLAETPMSHWEPAPFSTDPAASYALEEKVCTLLGWKWLIMYDESEWTVDLFPHDYVGPMLRPTIITHQSRLVAMCLKFLRESGVEFTLAEGWDKRGPQRTPAEIRGQGTCWR